MTKKVLNIIKTILLFAIVIMVIVFQNNISTIVLICGSGLFLVGIIDAFEKKEYSPLLISIGASLLLSIVLYKTNCFEFFETLTFFICISIIEILIITIVLNYLKTKKINKIYSKKVLAEIIESTKYPNSKKKYYQVVYEYSINDKSYEVVCPYYLTQKDLTKRSKIELGLNPKDDFDVFFKPQKSKKYFFYAASIFVILLAVLVLISIIV